MYNVGMYDVQICKLDGNTLDLHVPHPQSVFILLLLGGIPHTETTLTYLNQPLTFISASNRCWNLYWLIKSVTWKLILGLGK